MLRVQFSVAGILFAAAAGGMVRGSPTLRSALKVGLIPAPCGCLLRCSYFSCASGTVSWKSSDFLSGRMQRSTELTHWTELVSRR